jgi:hypothetical protein
LIDDAAGQAYTCPVTDTAKGDTTMATKIDNGSKVWVRGQFSDQFSIRGMIEIVDIRAERPIGVRLENGNFLWVYQDQIRGRNDG